MNKQALAEADQLQEKRIRYQKLAVPVRLGELAESLAFAKSALNHPKYLGLLARSLNESLACIDWTMADAAPATQHELADLRALLAGWRSDLQTQTDDLHKRGAIAAELTKWSQRVLELSGLTERENWQEEFAYPPGIRAEALV